jgi:hypothetical protein
MKRRRFLILSGVSCLALVACRLDQDGDARPAGPPGAAEKLQQLALTMTGAVGLGHAWSDTHPDEDLLGRLLLDLGIAGDAILDDEELLRRLNKRVESELEQGMRFDYAGWWLAPTEARLAALHVAMLGEASSDALSGTFETAVAGHVLEVRDFAPRQMSQGGDLSHHTLPDSVFWFAAPGAAHHLRIVISGSELIPTFQDSGFSVQIGDALLHELGRTPGEVPIWLWDPVRQIRQQVGVLTVAPKIEAGICPVEAWGPRSTQAAAVFNEQPDGRSAFWVSVPARVPDTTVLVFNGVELPTRVGDKVVTAAVPDPSLYRLPGDYGLELLDGLTGEFCQIGTFKVLPP